MGHLNTYYMRVKLGDPFSLAQDIIAHVVVFPDGTCVMRFCGPAAVCPVTTIWPTLNSAVHAHWSDEVEFVSGQDGSVLCAGYAEHVRVAHL